jgi:hypothetical protein
MQKSVKKVESESEKDMEKERSEIYNMQKDEENTPHQQISLINVYLVDVLL